MNKIIDFMNSMNDIQYGWIDKKNVKHINEIAKDIFVQEYILQTPEELEISRIGICWDQVEYERKFFEQNKIPFKTILIIQDDGIKYSNHTFLIFKLDKYYWFENTYNEVKGINEFNTFNDCLLKVKKEFIKENKLISDDKIFFFEYNRPDKKLKCFEFYEHCQKGTILDGKIKW